jgi:hypothetical protein
VQAALESTPGADLVAQCSCRLADLLGMNGVIPKMRPSNLLVESGQLGFFAG